MVKIKICGITNLEDTEMAVNLGANAIGFIFAKSPRRIESNNAEEIIKKFPIFINTVGVFVDEKREKVRNIAKNCRLDTLQFHGNETPAYCMDFLKDYKVIKTIKVESKESIENISKFLSLDAILLDTYHSKLSGGTGKKFNWEWVRQANNFNIPIILSGGLNPGNVKQAIKIADPYAVDVSSGVEIRPGVKDHRLMEEFILKIKKTENPE